MKDFLKSYLKFIPIVIMGVIIIISSFLFEKNKQQTYERTRLSKEGQVQIIASQIDLGVKLEPNYVTDKQTLELVEAAVENINEQDGVYCFLFDKECNLISEFNQKNLQQQAKGKEIVKTLQTESPQVKQTNNDYNGYIEITLPSNNENLLIYWQGLPSGDRNQCEYFIILSVSNKEVQENEAISTCKIMIGILIISLGLSLYANLYIKPYYEK